MANVPSGYRYYDASKDKYIAAGNAMPTIGDEDELAALSTNTDGYNYTYYADDGGWHAIVINEAQTTYEALKATINGKPLVRLSVCFMDCWAMVTAPTIPSSVVYMNDTFSNCKKLKNVGTIPPSVKYMGNCFEGCVALVAPPAIPSSVMYYPSLFRNCTSLKRITMNSSSYSYMGAAGWLDGVVGCLLEGDSVIKSTQIGSAAGRVCTDLQPSVSSFATVRCNSNGTADTNGTYARITTYITAPSSSANFNGAVLYPPTLERDGSAVSATWHIGSASGATVPSSGTPLQTGITLVAVVYNGQNSATYEIEAETAWDGESWTSSGGGTSPLTGKAVLIDGVSNGSNASVGILSYAPDNNGIALGGNTEVAGYVHATGEVKGSSVTATGNVSSQGNITAIGNILANNFKSDDVGEGRNIRLGDWLLQWGTVSITMSGTDRQTADVTFDVAFGATPYVFTTPLSTAKTSSNASGVSSTGCTIGAFPAANDTSTRTIRWLAIGRA